MKEETGDEDAGEDDEEIFFWVEDMKGGLLSHVNSLLYYTGKK